MTAVAAFRFEESEHRYFDENNIEVPSVTGCLDGAGLSDFSGIAPDVLERKRLLGQYVHQACEFLDQDDLIWESIDPACVPYVEAYESFKRDTGFIPQLIEKRGVAVINGSKVGFTLDRFGIWRGMPFIVDLKCGAQEGVSWRVQLAGYELCLPFCGLEGHLPAPMACGRAAVMLKPDGKYKVFPYDHVTNKKRSLAEARLDFDWFRACLLNETLKRRYA